MSSKSLRPLASSDELEKRVVIPRGCFSCGRTFPVQDVLESTERGSSFAFDAAKGRLWIVCTGCRSWMLVPIEDRWEVLEELKERTSVGGRVIGSTNQVSLILLGDLEVVRIGSAPVEEEAFWRYGRRMMRRQVLRNEMHGRASSWERVAHLITVGLPPSPGSRVGDASMEFIRWWQFGTSVRGKGRSCGGCGRAVSEVRLSRTQGLRLQVEADGSLEVRIPCRKCGDVEGAGASLRGVEGEHVLRRVLAYHNFYGATRAGVEAALRRIEEEGSFRRYFEQVSDTGAVLGELSPQSRLGLEIALDERIERSLRKLELRSLEERWLEEERLARIIDHELS